MELHHTGPHNVTSSLISPKLAAPDSQGVCLHFWFYLNDISVGSLSLYVTDDVGVRLYCGVYLL